MFVFFKKYQAGFWLKAGHYKQKILITGKLLCGLERLVVLKLTFGKWSQGKTGLMTDSVRAGLLSFATYLQTNIFFERLVLYDERLIRFRFFQFFCYEFGHFGERVSAAEVFQKQFHVFFFSDGNHFHCSLVRIFHPSGNFMLNRIHLRIIAKPHPCTVPFTVICSLIKPIHLNFSM